MPTPAPPPPPPKQLQIHLSLLLFIHLSLLLCKPISCKSDWQALLHFTNSLKPAPPASLFTSTPCPSNSPFILCSNGHITSISLSSMNLTGRLDLSPLSSMDMLSNLSLSHNRLSELILPTFGGYPSLSFLDLSHNSFSGEVPLGLTRMQALTFLDLSFNGFTGLVPEFFSSLGSLLYLDLKENGFSGGVERSLGLFRNLVRVDLSRNSLSGRLKSLQGSSNLMSSLKYLNVSHNGLSGELFSDEIPLFDVLEVFDGSHNRFEGRIPSFNFVFSLRVVLLQNNLFSGPVNELLLKEGSTTLAHLDLSGNQLEGPIGSITSTSLRILNLSNNKLNGVLPLRVGSCVAIDLSRNRISGNLSRIAGWGNFVEAIDLSSNSLQGGLPNNTGLFLRLISLKASNNSLKGELPLVLGTYPELQVLDFSMNKLSGPLPMNLLSYFRLSDLNLSKNSFTGSIPLPGNQNSSLLRLDLSDNFLSGSIPPEIGNLTALTMLNLGRNNFSGIIPGSISNLKSLQDLDLSGNHLEGEIPIGISSILIVLSLSGNNLSGIVPGNLLGFPDSSFYPGNSLLILPRESSGYGGESRHRWKRSVRILAIVGLAAATLAALLFFLLVFYWATVPRRRPNEGDQSQGNVPPAAQKDEAQDEEVVVGRDEAVQQSPLSSLFSASPEVRSPDKLMGELQILDGTLSFTAEELSRAPAEIIGRSFHGTTYRATLAAGGHVITVKWLRDGITKSKKDFSREARKLGHVRHANIVPLLAFYWGPRDEERLLISDYLPALSLATHLSEWETRKIPPLAATRRLAIAVDVANGLTYLHCERGIPHGNLKSSNVLVKETTSALSDFSLHRILSPAGTAEQVLNAGALGYRPPEFAATSKPSPSLKSDVYAFGVVLLELITGRSAAEIVSGDPSLVDLTDWVRLLAAQRRAAECFDKTLALVPPPAPPSFPTVLEGILLVALRCIGPASDRPEMAAVLRDLLALK